MRNHAANCHQDRGQSRSDEHDRGQAIGLAVTSLSVPDLPGWVRFLPRPFPSANLILLTGARPVLVDSGYGSDADATEQLVAAVVPISQLSLVINTHWHSDHVGGNHRLQSIHRVPVAAARADAEAINHRAPHACLAEWLDQPVEP